MKFASPKVSFHVEPKPSEPPPPPTGAKCSYTMVTPGFSRSYGFAHSTVQDHLGRLIAAGPATHSSYGTSDQYNAIECIDPAASTFTRLHPDTPKQDWVATDEFVKWFIPGDGYNWFVQAWTCVYDIDSGKFLASNIAASQAAAGDPVQNIPAMAEFVDFVVGRVKGDTTGYSPYEPAHAWSREHDVGVTIGGVRSDDRGTLIYKTPSAAKKLACKVFYMPFSARCPTDVRFGFPTRNINGGVCLGDWFYMFGSGTFSTYNAIPGYDAVPLNTVMRMHIPTIIACEPHTRLPDAACEYIGRIPGLYPDGVGNIATPCVTFDEDRNKVLVWNYRALEFDVADLDAGRLLPRDVTPDGYPTVGAWNGAYSRTAKAHYLNGGMLSTVEPGYVRPRALPPLSNGTPLYQNVNKLARFSFA